MMYDIIVFRIRNRFRPSTRKRKADVFKNLHSKERYWKGAFSVIIFNALVSVESRLNRRKKISVFKQNRIRVKNNNFALALSIFAHFVAVTA